MRTSLVRHVRTLTATLFVASLAFSTTAFAQDKPAAPGGQVQGGVVGGNPGAAPGGPKPRWVAACDADMKKLCKDEMKGDVRPCLAKNEDALSEDCKKTFLMQYKVAELCRDDITKHCKEAAAQGGLGKCLIEKKNDLSDKCRSALSRGSKQHQKMEKAEEAAAKKEEAVAEKPAKKKSK